MKIYFRVIVIKTIQVGMHVRGPFESNNIFFSSCKIAATKSVRIIFRHRGSCVTEQIVVVIAESWAKTLITKEE